MSPAKKSFRKRNVSVTQEKPESPIQETSCSTVVSTSTDAEAAEDDEIVILYESRSSPPKRKASKGIRKSARKHVKVNYKEPEITLKEAPPKTKVCSQSKKSARPKLTKIEFESESVASAESDTKEVPETTPLNTAPMMNINPIFAPKKKNPEPEEALMVEEDDDFEEVDLDDMFADAIEIVAKELAEGFKEEDFKRLGMWDEKTLEEFFLEDYNPNEPEPPQDSSNSLEHLEQSLTDSEYEKIEKLQMYKRVKPRNLMKEFEAADVEEEAEEKKPSFKFDKPRNLMKEFEAVDEEEKKQSSSKTETPNKVNPDETTPKNDDKSASPNDKEYISHFKMMGIRKGKPTQYLCLYKECNKILFYFSSLKGHYRIHSGELPWSCLNCEKRFRQKINLQSHVKRHHPSG